MTKLDDGLQLYLAADDNVVIGLRDVTMNALNNDNVLH